MSWDHSKSCILVAVLIQLHFLNVRLVIKLFYLVWDIEKNKNKTGNFVQRKTRIKNIEINEAVYTFSLKKIFSFVFAFSTLIKMA